MSLSERYFAAVRAGLEPLAARLFGDLVASARNDALAFLAESQAKLERWLDLLARGEIDREEFEFLVGSRRKLAEMRALQAAGVSRQRIEAFRRGVTNLLVSSAFALV